MRSFHRRRSSGVSAASASSSVSSVTEARGSEGPGSSRETVFAIGWTLSGDGPVQLTPAGFTSIPNALDDLGLGPYHYRVLVFIIRWKGKATQEKPARRGKPIDVIYYQAESAAVWG
jgi:hypothetical protein